VKLLVIELLLALAIVVFITMLGEYVFQPIPVHPSSRTSKSRSDPQHIVRTLRPDIRGWSRAISWWCRGRRCMRRLLGRFWVIFQVPHLG
jgi:hypothetical protein